MEMKKTLAALFCATGLISSVHAADVALATGDVIAIDVGNTTSSAASNFNDLGVNATIASGSVVKYNAPSDTAAGVSVVGSGMGGQNFDNGDWLALGGTPAGSVTDSYLVASAQDQVFSAGDATVTFSGLNSAAVFNVRVYATSGKGGDAGRTDNFIVTGLATTSQSETRGNRFAANDLVAAKGVFTNVSPSAAGSIEVKVDTDGYSILNAVVLEVVSVPVPVYNNALAGTAIMGRHTVVDATLGTPGSNQGDSALPNINDGDVNTLVDTWNNNDQTFTHSYAGVTWAVPQTQINSLKLTINAFGDGGWFGTKDDNDPTNDGTAGTDFDLAVQTTTDGTTWTTVGQTNDYDVTSFAAGDGAVAVNFTLTTAADNITGIRVIGTEGGTSNRTPASGFLAVRELEVLSSTEAVVPNDILTIDFNDDDENWIVVDTDSGTLAAVRHNWSFYGRTLANTAAPDGSDGWIGIIESPIFTLSNAANYNGAVTFFQGGGTVGWYDGTNNCYVAVYDASDDSEITRSYGASNSSGIAQNYDLSAYKGQNVYFRLVDNKGNGWGHSALDDLVLRGAIDTAATDARRAVTPAIGLEVSLTGTDLVWTVEDEIDVKEYRVVNAETKEIIETVIAVDADFYSVTVPEGVEVELVVVDNTGFAKSYAPEDGNVKIEIYDLAQGWNLIAITSDDADLETLKDETVGVLWGWNGTGYEVVDTASATDAVWVYSPLAKQVYVSGTKSSSEISLTSGWNMVGPVTETQIPADADSVFSWGEKIYKTIADEQGVLIGGKGYWIFSL